MNQDIILDVTEGSQINLQAYGPGPQGPPGPPPSWGTILGTLSNQTDLSTALAAKAPVTALPTQATFATSGLLKQTVYNVKDYGAKGDGQYTEDGAITSGTATLVSASAIFNAGTDVGKSISVEGASNTDTGTLTTTILSVTNSTTVVLATNATASKTSAEVTWGTDDYTAVQATITAAEANPGGGRVWLPLGVYLISVGLLVTGQNIQIQGAGWSLPITGWTNAVMPGNALTSIRPIANMTSGSYALTFNNTSTMIIGGSLSDINLDGRAIRTNNIGGIHYGNAAFFTSERFTVTLFSGDCIHIDMANSAYSVPSVSQMWFDNFALIGGGSNGITFGDNIFASDFFITNAFIWGMPSGHGIHLGTTSGMQATFISDSDIGECTIGIWCGSFEVTVHDVLIEDSHSHGIYINNPHNNGYFSKIHGNILRDNDQNMDGSSDIYIATGSYNYILENNICERVASGGENGITVVDGNGVNGNSINAGNFSTGHTVSNFKSGATIWNDTHYPGTVPSLTINNINNSNVNGLNITQNDTTNNPVGLQINQNANAAALFVMAAGTTGGGNVVTGIKVATSTQTGGDMMQIYNTNNSYAYGGFRGMLALENGAATSSIDALAIIQSGTGNAISVYNGYGSKTFTVDKLGDVKLSGSLTLSGFLGTGILKQTTSTGALSIAVAADFPTLNQSTTGNAATATAASGLLSASTTVAVSAATAPTTGQVLTATGGSAATWQTLPAGSSGTVSSISVVTANGISGSVATATTTPAITLTLGAITPTSVNSVALSGSSTPTLAVTGTSSISGSNTGDQTNISGNAATVTTNANLTGPITSSGNATSIAAQTGTGTTFAMSASPTFTGTVSVATLAGSGAATITTASASNLVPLTLTQNDTTNNPVGLQINQNANAAALFVMAAGTNGGGNVVTGIKVATSTQTGGDMMQIYNTNNSYAYGGFRGMLALENGAATSSIDALAIIQSGTGNAISVYNGYGSKTFTVDKFGTVTHLHLAGLGTAPTIAAGTGAGTSPTISLTGHDVAGQISVTTGTLPTLSGTVFTVTFNTAFSAAPYVLFSPANGNAAALSGLTMVYATSTTTTFVFTAGTTALAATTTYLWNYHVIG